MKVNEVYHIDVTEEESKLFADVESGQSAKIRQSKNPVFKKMVLIVTGVHIVVLAGVACLAGPVLNTSASEIKHTGIENPVASQAEQQADKEFVQTSSHEPTPTPSPVQTSTPQPTTTSVKPKQSALVKTYIVKQGDTIYSIAKKYKLNTKRLLEINEIKDQNKIAIGQTLKFM